MHLYTEIGTTWELGEKHQNSALMLTGTKIPKSTIQILVMKTM